MHLLHGITVKSRERRQKWLFVSPAVVVAATLSLFPFLYSIFVAFTDLNLSSVGSDFPFNGFDNWTRLAGDHAFLSSALNTIGYVIVSVLLQYTIGLTLALALNKVGRTSQKFFRTAFLLPMMLTPVAVGFVIGRTMFAQEHGPINFVLAAMHLPPIAWEESAWAAWLKIVVVDTWEWVPFMLIVLFAAVRSLPQEPFEAARIDGASGWMIFRRLTFPMLWPATVTVLLIRGVELFKLLDIVQITTGGGPGTATSTVTLEAYRTVFRGFEIGYAAAMALTLFLMITFFATAFTMVARRRID